MIQKIITKSHLLHITSHIILKVTIYTELLLNINL